MSKYLQINYQTLLKPALSTQIKITAI